MLSTARKFTCVVAASLVVWAGVAAPAEAAEAGECTIATWQDYDVKDAFNGRSTTRVNCNNARNVTVMVENWVWAGPSWALTYTKLGPEHWGTVSATRYRRTYHNLVLANEWLTISRVCYKWGTSSTKCRESSARVGGLR